LHVQDSGTGIPPDVLAHIWEPFFTTKQSCKGTGLGLSTVRGIIDSHAGFVTVATAQDQGTTFRIHLPAHETGVGSGATIAATPAAPGGGELVLVVDDEPNIRNMSAAILARHGYRVLTAADGAEAIALFAARSRDIRIVVTDMSMPNLDGDALAALVRRLNPAVKVIMVSGLAPSGPTSGPAARPSFADAFLSKPYGPETLLATVFRLLHPAA